jgi:hypothetical protein
MAMQDNLKTLYKELIERSKYLNTLTPSHELAGRVNENLLSIVRVQQLLLEGYEKRDNTPPPEDNQCYPDDFIGAVASLYEMMQSKENQNELSNQTDDYYQGNREGWKANCNFYPEFRDVAEFSRHVIKFFDPERFF